MKGTKTNRTQNKGARGMEYYSFYGNGKYRRNNTFSENEEYQTWNEMLERAEFLKELWNCAYVNVRDLQGTLIAQV